MASKTSCDNVISATIIHGDSAQALNVPIKQTTHNNISKVLSSSPNRDYTTLVIFLCNRHSVSIKCAVITIKGNSLEEVQVSVVRHTLGFSICINFFKMCFCAS